MFFQWIYHTYAGSTSVCVINSDHESRIKFTKKRRGNALVDRSERALCLGTEILWCIVTNEPLLLLIKKSIQNTDDSILY